MKRWILVLGLAAGGFVYGDSFAPNTNYQVCFTPGQDCTQLIVSSINNAQRTIDLQAYSFTSKPIIKAILAAEQRGVKVQAILDKSDLGDPVVSELITGDIPVWIDYTVRIAHNKVMIIDGTQLITGSFNFTNAAQYRNAENVLIINNAQLAAQYTQNFISRQSDSLRYKLCLQSYQCSHSKYQGDNF